MDNFDLVNRFEQEYDRLNQAWQAARDRHQNARTALGNVLTFLANRDPRFQSAHSEIVQVKQRLAEVRRIEEQLIALLDQLDGDLGQQQR